MNLREVLNDSFQGVAMGLMDGLITLLGIVMGVGVATGNPDIVVISGMVGGVANSFGTSMGFYTSEQAERGQQIAFYKKKSHSKAKDTHKYIHSQEEILFSTAFSFLSGVAALVLPIIPFFIGLDMISAMAGCFLISITMLYSLGFRIGNMNNENAWLSGFKYAGIGIVSAIVSLLIGELLKHILLENAVGIF